MTLQIVISTSSRVAQTAGPAGAQEHMADVQQQLSALLGREVGRIRKTNDTPARVSVVDTIAVITGKNANHSAEAMRDLGNRYPEVNGGIVHLKFPGRGQRNTPVADARGIVEVIMLLPGAQAARIRRQAAELLVRFLGGDLGIVAEVCALTWEAIWASSRKFTFCVVSRRNWLFARQKIPGG